MPHSNYKQERFSIMVRLKKMLRIYLVTITTRRPFSQEDNYNILSKSWQQVLTIPELYQREAPISHHHTQKGIVSTLRTVSQAPPGQWDWTYCYTYSRWSSLGRWLLPGRGGLRECRPATARWADVYLQNNESAWSMDVCLPDTLVHKLFFSSVVTRLS